MFKLAMAALGAMALVTAIALVLLTTHLYDASRDLEAAVHSVHLADSAELDLLLYTRAQDPVVRASREQLLRDKLERLGTFVTTEAEAEALARARASVEQHLMSRPPPDVRSESLAEAYRALQHVATINLAQAGDQQRQAAAYDRLANVLGVTAALLLIGSLATFFRWVRRGTFLPLLGIAAAMRRNALGERDARAPESGVAEVHDIGKTFNDMAEALARQRDHQLTVLAGIAHDLRNPLSALSLTTEIFDESRPLPDERRLRQGLGVVRRQVRTLARMVDDLLDAARLEAGKVELELESHDLRQLVRQSTELLDAGTRRIEVVLGAEPLLVLGDSTRLEQIITNLVSNALKFSPADRPVLVRAARAGGEIVLSVQDQGVGLSPAEVEQLFVPFQRLGGSRGTTGSGLGLSIVRRLVEAHGGRIEIESEKERGSTFEVHLPLAASTPAQAASLLH